jgi:hypothetical protein
VEAQAEAIAKKSGFASLAEFDDVSVSISAVMSGIDPQTKKFTEPPSGHSRRTKPARKRRRNRTWWS